MHAPPCVSALKVTAARRRALRTLTAALREATSPGRLPRRHVAHVRRRQLHRVPLPPGVRCEAASHSTEARAPRLVAADLEIGRAAQRRQTLTHARRAGLLHSAYTFGLETNIAESEWHERKPALGTGGLVRLLQRGLQYIELEANQAAAPEGAAAAARPPPFEVFNASEILTKTLAQLRSDLAERRAGPTESEEGGAPIEAAQRGATLAHEREVFQAAWSPNGCQLLTRGNEGAAHVWTLGSSRDLHTRLLAAGRAAAGNSDDAAGQQPEGQTLVHVLNDADVPMDGTTQGAAAVVSAMAWRGDGLQICTAGSDGSLALWAPAERRDDGSAALPNVPCPPQPSRYCTAAGSPMLGLHV